MSPRTAAVPAQDPPRWATRPCGGYTSKGKLLLHVADPELPVPPTEVTTASA